MKSGSVLTALDANMNRALEGLRVCEDIFRFAVRNSLSSEFKFLRHGIADASACFSGSQLIASRDVESDAQKFVDTEGEGRREGLADLFRANIRRSAESVRSLEEFSKTINPGAGAAFQDIRFRIYDVEKKGWALLQRNSLLEKLQYRLYAIIDSSFVRKESMADTARILVNSGAGVIQLRMKESPDSEFLSIARELGSICRSSGGLFIVNDRPDIAALCDAHGLHLGQVDMSPSEARKITGENMIIGLSVHCRDEALRGCESDADYIAIGPVFPGVTKTGEFLDGIGIDAVKEICGVMTRPVVCFSGITLENIHAVMETGCSTAAVISSLYAGGDLAGNTARFNKIISSFAKDNNTGNNNEKES